MKPFVSRGENEAAANTAAARSLAIRGAGVTVLSSVAGLAFQVSATVILARLLTPADFGVVTMVTTVSLLFANFGLNGFTEAILQREEIGHPLVSNLFWVNLGVGLLLTITFAKAGSLLGRFYHDPTVSRVAVGMSLTIFITSTSVIHIALLKRAMRFSLVSANDICARGTSVIVSILLAWAGWGYWALVAGAAALPLTQSIGAWILCRWIPGLPRRVEGTASMVGFALNVYGRFGVNYLSRNVDNVLVGWRFNSMTLGFYKKAYDLFTLSASILISSLSNVAVAALSRFSRDSVQYRRYILNTLAVTAFVGMGLGGDLTLAGKDVIRFLLGPGWEPAGRIFTCFGPGIGIMLLYGTHGWIHLSIGKADRWFRWGIIEFAFTALLFLVALPWGPEGIAVAWTASFWILAVPAFWYAVKPIQLDTQSMIAAVWRFPIASLAAGGLSALLLRFTPSFLAAPTTLGAFLRVITVSAVFGVTYLSAVALLHRGFQPFYLVAGLLGEMRSGQPHGVPCLVGNSTNEIEVDAPQEFLSDQANSQPLVSILIPAHNAQEWIAHTLRSALAQTWQRKEIIVVDDGSTDGTLSVAQRFEPNGVIVVTQPNQGAAAARNFAYSLSQGEYIQWLDADDLLASNKIEKQMAVASRCESKRTLISSAWGCFMHRYYRAKFLPTALWCDLSPVEWLYRKMNENLYMQTASWLVSRELSEAAGSWNTRLLSDDDGEYFCRVLSAADGVRFVPGAKVYYRGPGLAFRSLSYVGGSAKRISAHWLSMQLHITYLLALEDSGRTRAACLNYLQASFLLFYPENIEILKQAQKLARELGGDLRPPVLSWKYSWIKTLFGWKLGKRGQQFLLAVRWLSTRCVDKFIFRLETHRSEVHLLNANVRSTLALGAALPSRSEPLERKETTLPSFVERG